MRGRTTSIGIGFALVLTSVMASAVSAQNAAEQYCTEKGGRVVELKPYLQPGSDSQVELGTTLNVCQFIAQDGDNVTQLVVDLSTLHSEHPTLAGLAYLAKVPSSNSGAAGSNPASSYCPVDLAGTEAFGTASSGAWMGDLDPGMEAGDSEPLGNTVNLCVFADRSAMDDFALFYHSDGTIRGIDLTTVMVYQASDDTPNPYSSGGSIPGTLIEAALSVSRPGSRR